MGQGKTVLEPIFLIISYTLATVAQLYIEHLSSKYHEILMFASKKMTNNELVQSSIVTSQQHLREKQTTSR